MLTARQPQALAALTASHEDRALALKLDVTSEADIEQAVAAAEERFGQIEVLVDNAGYGYLAVTLTNGASGAQARYEVQPYF